MPVKGSSSSSRTEGRSSSTFTEKKPLLACYLLIQVGKLSSSEQEGKQGRVATSPNGSRHGETAASYYFSPCYAVLGQGSWLNAEREREQVLLQAAWSQGPAPTSACSAYLDPLQAVSESLSGSIQALKVSHDMF